MSQETGNASAIVAATDDAGISTISTRDLESLPDYLLIQIFKSLPLGDLYSVSLLNARFQSLAVSFRAAYTLNVADFFLASHAIIQQASLSDPATQLRQHYKSVLANIGPHIDTLHIDKNRMQDITPLFDESHFLQAADEHLSGTLRHLHVRNCELTENWDAVPALLHGLRTLHLENCCSRTGFRHCAEPIADYRSETIYDDTDERMPDARALLALRNLEAITLMRCKHTLHAPQIVQLIENNQRLEHVQIHHNSRLGSGDLVPALHRVLGDRLRTLSLCHSTTQEHDLSALAGCVQLCKLQLVNYYQPTGGSQQTNQPLDALMRALHGNTTIVELDLHHCRVSVTALAAVATMQALRVLKLRKNYWLTNEGGREVGRHGRLRSIDCYDSLNLTDEGVLAMVAGNRQLELLDVSWLPQLTEDLLSGIRRILSDRHSKEERHNDDYSDNAADGRRLVLRVMLNGRNRIDWTRVAKRQRTAVATGEEMDGFLIYADPLEHLSVGEASMFRVYYDRVIVLPKKDDWPEKYRLPIFEIN